MIPEEAAIVRPDLVAVAHREDHEVRLALSDWPGLRLSGPGAEGALRAWIAALVTRDGPYGAEILVLSELGERLLPGIELPSVRRLDGIEALLTRLEAAAIGRTRRLEDAAVPDAAAYRHRAPEDPFPLLLAVVGDLPARAEARWSAVVAAASRLGFAALVLGTTEEGEPPLVEQPGLAVRVDGTVGGAVPGTLGELLAGATLFQLDASTAADLLGPVAAVHHDAEPVQPGGPEPPTPGADDAGRPAADRNATGSAAPAGPSWPGTAAEQPATAPAIRIGLLGPPWVEAWGEEITNGLRASAYELLAWYALHPGGAASEAAIDALWPDASPRRGRERFWTALGNLRSRLHPPGDDGVEILTRSGDWYRPDPAVLEVDLWRFEAALGDAARGAEPALVAGALEGAAGAYGGDFCPGLDALWVEPVREDLHRRALDVHLRLAQLYAEGQPERAIAVLERTIEVDPICEDAYRRLITLQASLDRRDAAQRTWRLLQGRLAELDLDPEETTEHLVHELLAPRPATSRRLPSPRRTGPA